MPDTTNPQALRTIFGRNLATLAARERSIADLSRSLGINRTQFHRYLNGEAFPRPDVLYRICRHFGTDARILLEPLETIRPIGMAVPAGISAFWRSFPTWPDVGPDPGYLPDGIYRTWKRSFNLPEMILVSLARIWREGNETRFRTFEQHAINPVTDGTSTRVKRKLVGFVVAVEDGVQIPTAIVGMRLVRNTYLRKGFSGVGTLYSGFTTLGRDRIPGFRRTTMTLMEQLGRDRRELLAAVRGTGYRRPEELSPMLRDFVMSDSVD